MARASWEVEAELESLGSNNRPKRRGRGIFTALLLVVVATFVVAYYLPLLRTHQELTGLYGEATERLRASDRKLEQVQTELRSITADRDKLAAEGRKQSDATAARGATIESLRATLGSKLKSHADGGRLTLSSSDGRVVIAIRQDVLFAPKKDEVSRNGELLLCDVAKAADSRALDIVGQANAPEGWTTSAARTARVAEALESKCAVPAARLSTAVRASGKAATESGAAERIELRVTVD